MWKTLYHTFVLRSYSAIEGNISECFPTASSSTELTLQRWTMMELEESCQCSASSPSPTPNCIKHFSSFCFRAPAQSHQGGLSLTRRSCCSSRSDLAICSGSIHHPGLYCFGTPGPIFSWFRQYSSILISKPPPLSSSSELLSITVKQLPTTRTGKNRER